MKIYNEDCLVTMARMPEGSVDLVVTSPPYDDLRKYNGYSFDFEKVAKALFHVVKVGGVVVWVVADATKDGDESGTSFRQALFFKQIGFKLHDTMIYRKTKYLPLTHPRYEQAFEYMFVFVKGKLATFNPIMVKCKHAGHTPTRTFYQTSECNLPTTENTPGAVAEFKQKENVWDFGATNGVKGHPAQFPEALANDHILSWSNVEDLVYDPFTGAGTTGKMASLLNRRFVGSEISKEFCAIAEARILDTF